MALPCGELALSGHEVHAFAPESRTGVYVPARHQVVISKRESCVRRNRQGGRNTCWTGRAGAAHRTSVAGLAVQVLWRRKDRESEHANEIDREREKGKVRERVISLHSRLLYQFEILVPLLTPYL